MRQLLVTLLFLLVGFILVQGAKYFYQLQNPTTSPQLTNATQFSLVKAPNQSLQGKIASLSGTVNWLSRVATKTSPPKHLQNIQQGEELSTGKNGQVIVQIKNFVSLAMASESQLNFIQLLPINLILMQDSGIVTYAASGMGTLSIRSHELLTILNKGVVTISIDKEAHTITIEAIKGTLHEGYVDTQGSSKVVTLNQGQSYIFDEIRREGITKGVAIINPSFLNH